MNTKYIVIQWSELVGEVMIVFPEYITHRDMRDDLSRSGSEVISAGFIMVNDDGKFYCHGESLSLGKVSRPGDSIIANRMFMEG